MEPPLLPRHRPEDHEIPDGMSLLYADLPERREPVPAERARVDLVLGGIVAAAGVAFVGSGVVGDLVRRRTEAPSDLASPGLPQRPVVGVEPLVGEAAPEAGPVLTPTDVSPAPEIEYAAPPAPALDPPPLPDPGVGSRPIAPGPDTPPALDPPPATTTTAPTTTTSPPATTTTSPPATTTTSPPATTTTTPPATTTTSPPATTTTAPTTTTTTTPPPAPRAETRLFAASFGFSATPAMVATVDEVGVEGWVEQQLEPTTVADPMVEAALVGFDLLDDDPVALRAAGRADEALAQSRWAGVTRSYVGERQVLEAVVGAWREYFAVRTDSADELGLDQVIRRRGLGRFDDLLVEVARTPAVIRATSADRVDGSAGPALPTVFARALLERFTVGPGVASEAEVRAVAAVMSGWSVDGSGRFVFVPGRHSSAAASALGWSTGGSAGEGDGEALLRHLAGRPETATRVAGAICTRLLGSAPPDVVARAAQAYRAADTDVRAVVRVALRSAAPGAPRRGGEWVLAALRGLRAEVDIGRPWTAAVADSVPFLLRAVGDEPGNEARRAESGVVGWWESPYSVSRRWSVARRLVRPDGGAGVSVDLDRLRPPDVMTARAYVTWLADQLDGTRPADDEIEALLAYMGRDGGDEIGPDRVPDESEIADLAALVLSFPSFMARGGGS